MIALGVAMFSLLLVAALRRTGSSPRAVPEGKLAYAESQRVFKAARIRIVASRVLLITPPVQPVYAILLAAVEAETDSDRRSDALDRAVESISAADRPATLDSLALNASPGAAEMSLLLVRGWAESDPSAAATWTLQLGESPAYRAALEQVAIAWAKADLPAATSWVHALPEGGSQQAATFDLAYEAARTEPIASLELASKLLPTLERDDLLVHAISQWAGFDSATAATWATEESDPVLRQRLVASVAIVLAEQNAIAAVTLAVNGLVAGEEQDRAAVSIVQRWAQLSAQAAATWVSQFPDIPSRDAAVENLLSLWTTQDAVAAGNWLRELPAGPVRDVGTAAYAQAMADLSWNPAVVIPARGM